MRYHLLLIVGLLFLPCACRSNLPPAPVIPAISEPLAACAPANGSTESSVITAAELQRTRASSLYDAIRKLRPAYFISRGPSSIQSEPATAIVVIVNRHVIGGVDDLQIMDATHISCIRRLPAAEVTLITGRFGSAVGIELVY